MRINHYLASLAMLCGIALSSSVLAADIGSNYTFPDGSAGFYLAAPSDPGLGVLLGFNPTAGGPATTLSLDDPTTPILSNSYSSPQPFTFGVYLSFLGIANATLPNFNSIPPGPCASDIVCGIPPGPCDTDINCAFPPGPCDGDIQCSSNAVGTGFSFDGTIDGQMHEFDVTLVFDGGGGFDGSWSAINPQPDPPGDGMFVDIGFNGSQDPLMAVVLSEDGNPVTLAPVPEPATCGLFAAALAGLLPLGRRRSKRSHRG